MVEVPVVDSRRIAPADLRADGAVLLLSCYELGHQPHGIAMPAAFLRHAGFAPAVQDLSIEALDEDAVRRARLIGIAVPMHTALRLGMRALERIRELNPHAHVCMYGHYALLNAEYVLSHGVDTCLGGESEAALVAVAEALESNEAPLSMASVLERLEFPLPERTDLPKLGNYAALKRDGEHFRVGYVEASRGCKHHCAHCPIVPVYGGRFFVVPQVVVLEDIRRQVAMGAEHITFGDPDFLNGPRHAMGILRAMRREFPALTFDVTAKVEHLLKHQALLPELVELGCAFVVSAFESFDDTVLRHLRKGHTRADASELLRLARDAGLALRPTFVPFTPWAAIESLVELFDIVEREDLIDAVDPVQFTIRLLIPPGSPLAVSESMYAYLRELDQANFVHRWEHPDPRMDRLQEHLSEIAAAGVSSVCDELETFCRLRDAAREAAGLPETPWPAVHAKRARTPRLTEPWFC